MAQIKVTTADVEHRTTSRLKNGVFVGGFTFTLEEFIEVLCEYFELEIYQDGLSRDIQLVKREEK